MYYEVGWGFLPFEISDIDESKVVSLQNQWPEPVQQNLALLPLRKVESRGLPCSSVKWINPAAICTCPARAENVVQWKHTTEADSDPAVSPCKYEISSSLTDFDRIAGVHKSWKHDASNQSFRQPIWLEESCQSSTKTSPLKFNAYPWTCNVFWWFTNPGAWSAFCSVGTQILPTHGFWALSALKRDFRCFYSCPHMILPDTILLQLSQKTFYHHKY